MKNLLIALAAIVVLAAAGLAAAALYLFYRNESEKNRAKTAPAREARWKDKEDPKEDPVKEPENDLNKTV